VESIFFANIERIFLNLFVEFVIKKNGIKTRI
ncbi:MAG: hypothetical protein ACI976_001522, partial [Aureispira sp.]